MSIFKLSWYIWYPISLVIGLVGFFLLVMMVVGAQYWWDVAVKFFA